MLASGLWFDCVSQSRFKGLEIQASARCNGVDTVTEDFGSLIEMVESRDTTRACSEHLLSVGKCIHAQPALGWPAEVKTVVFCEAPVGSRLEVFPCLFLKPLSTICEFGGPPNHLLLRQLETLYPLCRANLFQGSRHSANVKPCRCCSHNVASVNPSTGGCARIGRARY